MVDAVFSAEGIDVSAALRELIRAEFPELETRGLLGDLPETPEAEIAACYRRLRALAVVGDDGAYARTLAHLRELQGREADRLSTAFDDRRQLDPVAAENALRQAEALLTAHAGSSAED